MRSFVLIRFLSGSIAVLFILFGFHKLKIKLTLCFELIAGDNEPKYLNKYNFRLSQLFVVWFL